MAGLEHKFEEPTKDNVEVGDFLVVINPGIPGLAPAATYGLIEINELTEDRIEGEHKDGTTSMRYGDAIVLKKGGNYLVGKFVNKYSKSLN